MHAGQRLGSYEIVGPLGAGGMGEVWQATDTRLGRSVALKLLPEAFAADPDRLARFEREAKLLAALSHPNIAGLYALEEASLEGRAAPVRFLAMELVPGEDLADRLKRGPLPVQDAIEIARQVAEALEEAHDKGIVHRDLKPANVKVTPDGKVKVLDFGLAKAWSDESASSSAPSSLSESPTLANTGTAAGIVLGTAPYMSPEQARGRPVDRRSDIWSFGVLLFEMLSGERLFAGETVSDTLAAVLKTDPDWARLPSGTPLAASRLLRRCLERDPRRRLQAIGEARIALTDPFAADASGLSARASGRRAWLPWLVAAVSLAVAALAARREPPAVSAPLLQLDVQLSDDLQLASLIGHGLAVSPDGTRLAFVGQSGSEPALYLRALDQPNATPIPDTVRAVQPFFSPDGREIGFFTGGELRRVSLAGGASNLITAVEGDARGATWGPDGSIVFVASASGALARVSASGGTPAALTTLDAGKGERSHRWPSFVPGSRKLVFNVHARNRTYDDASIELVDLDSGQRSVLGTTGAAPRFALGRLLFVRRGRLHAAALDAASWSLAGAPAVLAEGVHSDPRNGSAHYTVSQGGVIAFVQGQDLNAERIVEWNDRTGRTRPFLDRPAQYLSPRFSPDGGRLALQIGELGREDVYVAAATDGALTRLTFGAESDHSPVWSPDGTRIVHASVSLADNITSFHVRNADGSGASKPIYTAAPGQIAMPTSWSADGAQLLFQEGARGTGFDIHALDLASGKARSLVATPVAEIDACFSPDGRFVAYVAGAAGARQVYVRTLAEGGGHWQLPTEGGARPVWLRGGEIVYQRPSRPLHEWISVPVRTHGDTFVAGTPRPLFHSRVDAEALQRVWDIAPDGTRLALVQPVGGTTAAPGVRVRMLFGWTRLLERGGASPQ